MWLDLRPSRSRRSPALYRVSSRLHDAGQAAHPAGNAATRPQNRPRQRAALRLRGQRPRRRREQHVLRRGLRQGRLPGPEAGRSRGPIAGDGADHHGDERQIQATPTKINSFARKEKYFNEILTPTIKEIITKSNVKDAIIISS